MNTPNAIEITAATNTPVTHTTPTHTPTHTDSATATAATHTAIAAAVPDDATADPHRATGAAADPDHPAGAAAITRTPTDADALAALLAQAPPAAGPLGELEFDRLSPAGRLDAVLAWERLARHAHAGLIRCLGTLAHDAADERWLIETELSAALAWAPATTQTRLHEAHALVRLFPHTLHLLSDGQVSLEQARSLAQLTSGLSDEAARATEARVLARMPGQSPAATRQAIRRAVLRADPQAAANRHRYERARRRVELRPEDDGMATLSFYLPADVAQMAMRTLTAMAQNAQRTNKNSGDTRTLDQRRADLLPVLLTRATGTDHPTTTPPAIPARVHVVVGIETLLGLSHEPGHLQGYGPICPEQTRRIANAHAARWRFLLTATDGTPVDTSPRTYTPSAAIKHLTRLKHTTCAFPHCAMPADRCDLDHNQAFHQGGLTSVDNLAPLCRRHHNHKSFGHWDLRRNDDDTISWSSNLTGRSYTTTGTRYQPAPTADCNIQNVTEH